MWISRLVPGLAPDGTPILSVLAKRTYRYAPDQEAKYDPVDPLPFFDADVLEGQGRPGVDAPLQESDLVPWKPRVDVVVHGLAFAPSGKRGLFFDTNVRVGECSATVRVFGDRRADLSSGSLRFTNPEPFETMPIHWGRAFGGVDRCSHPDIELPFPPNPLGKGFVVDPSPEHLHGTALPNLENPQDLLVPERLLVKKYERWPRAPQPSALGWMPRNAHRRIQQAILPLDESDSARERRKEFALNMPQALLRHPAPPGSLHQSFEERNGAPPFLRPRSLEGGETVVLTYLDAKVPRLEFTLPAEVPQAYLDLGEGMIPLPMDAQTVEIYTPTRQVSMLWRGSARYPGLDWLTAHPEVRFEVES